MARWQLATGTRWAQPIAADHLMAFLEAGVAEHPDFHDGWLCIRERCVPLTREQARHRSTILVTDSDANRLELVLKQHGGVTNAQDLAALRAELQRAVIVNSHSVPPDVITMNSRVVCEDERAGTRSEADVSLSERGFSEQRERFDPTPLGTALLGVSVGQLLELPRDHARPWRVTALPYQPEREGCF